MKYFKSAGVIVAIIVLAAVLDEYHQSFVAGRTSSGVDVVIDSIGGLSFIIIKSHGRDQHAHPLTDEF